MKNTAHLEMINSVMISLHDMEQEFERNFGVNMGTLKDGLGKGNISTDDWIHDKLGDFLGDIYEGYTEVMDQVAQYVPWYSCILGPGYSLLAAGARWVAGAVGIPPQPSYNDLLDPDFIHELTQYYGASPFANNNGFLQSLHSSRLWTYEGTGTDGWGRIASAYRSCTAIRRRILHATLNALYAKHNGDPLRAIRWLGHATHIIEDSFAQGHTKRDAEMYLTDILFSGWSFPFIEEAGLEMAPVAAHSMVEEKDTWWNEEWARQADAEYLKAASGLFGLLRESPFDWERIKRATVMQLEPFFDYSHHEDPTIKDRPGHFDRSFLSKEMPISIERYLSRKLDEPWSILVPLPWSQPGSPPSEKSSLLFAYSTESGKYTFDKITSSLSGKLRMTNFGLDVMESGWQKFAPFVGIDGSPWMIVYRKDDGRSALYRVDLSEKKVECVETSLGWPAGLGALVTVRSGTFPYYAIGYDRQSTLLHVARLDTLSAGLGTFFQPISYYPPTMTNPRGDGYNLVTVALCQDGDELQAAHVPSIIFHNPESGDVRIERILFDNLLPQAPAGVKVNATKQIGKGIWEKDSSMAVPYLLERRVRRQTGLITYLLKYAENNESVPPTQKITSRPLWFIRLETAGPDDQKVPQYIRAGFFDKRAIAQTFIPLSFRNKPYLLVQSTNVNDESKISIYRIESVTSTYSDVLISTIRYNSHGYDDRSNDSLNDEFIEIENDSKEPVDLTNWTLHHHTSFIYKFGSITLQPSESVRIHSGQGENSHTDLYMGKRNYVWNNRRDEATLRDANGAIEDFCEYRRNDREIWVF